MTRTRAIALPLVALVLAAGLIGVHLAAGAQDYKPLVQPDPCRAPLAKAARPEIEPVAELVVLTGLGEAACTLKVSRVRLLLALASPADRQRFARAHHTNEAGLERTLRSGLRRGVDRLDRAGRLPKASALAPSLLAQASLPDIAKAALKRLPGGVVDGLAPTGPVLRRAIARLDVHTILTGLDDPDQLQGPIRDALVAGAVAEVRERLAAKIPGSLRDILGIG